MPHNHNIGMCLRQCQVVTFQSRPLLLWSALELSSCSAAEGLFPPVPASWAPKLLGSVCYILAIKWHRPFPLYRLSMQPPIRIGKPLSSTLLHLTHFSGQMGGKCGCCPHMPGPSWNNFWQCRVASGQGVRLQTHVLPPISGFNFHRARWHTSSSAICARTAILGFALLEIPLHRDKPLLHIIPPTEGVLRLFHPNSSLLLLCFYPAERLLHGFSLGNAYKILFILQGIRQKKRVMPCKSAWWNNELMGISYEHMNKELLSG